MKTIRLRSAAVLGALFLSFFCPTGGLKSVAAPHAGVYECKTLTIDGRDALLHFSSVSVELKGDGTGKLHCKDRLGNTVEEELCYEREEGSDEILFIYKHGEKELRIPAAYEKGELVFTRQAGERLIVAVFSKK